MKSVARLWTAKLLVAKGRRWTERCANSRRTWMLKPLGMLLLVKGLATAMAHEGEVSVDDVVSVVAADRANKASNVVTLYMGTLVPASASR